MVDCRAWRKCVKCPEQPLVMSNVPLTKLSAADGRRCMANEIVSFGQWSLWTSLFREAQGSVSASSESFVLTCPSDCVSGRGWSAFSVRLLRALRSVLGPR